MFFFDHTHGITFCFLILELKGAPTRDFWPLVSFMNLLLLSPRLLCYSHLDFFPKMAEIFECIDLSPVSLTPVINLSPVSLTPAVNLLPVSLTLGINCVSWYPEASGYKNAALKKLYARFVEITKKRCQWSENISIRYRPAQSKLFSRYFWHSAF